MPNHVDFYVFVPFWIGFIIFMFCISTLCSARSQINFVGKKIWDLSKKFSFEKITALIPDNKIMKSCLWFHTIELFVCLVSILIDFVLCMFLYKHLVLCEISNKFCRQKIWDLSKTFSSGEITTSWGNDELGQCEQDLCKYPAGHSRAQ